MKRLALSLIIGFFVAAAIMATMILVGTTDMRLLLVFGIIAMIGGGLWIAGRTAAGFFDLILFSAPLIGLFVALALLQIPALWPIPILWGFTLLTGFFCRRTRRDRRLTAVTALLAVLILFAAYAGLIMPGVVSRALNRDRDVPIPNFVLQSLTGSEILPAAWTGKVVVLNFFGTWCGPCIAELPKFAEVRAHFADRSDFVFLVVANESGGDSIDKVRNFAEHSGRGLTFVWDPAGKAHRAFGFSGVPAMVVIDRIGHMRRVREGYNPSETDFSRTLVDFLNLLDH